MEILVLSELASRSATTGADAVLPALDLLPHTVRTAPRDVRTLVSGPSPDAVLVDARSELAEARATCRMLHATGLGVPLIAVVTEAGLIALNADWGVDDVILASAGPGRGRGPAAAGRRPAHATRPPAPAG